jgi:uroporphyrin-III C-methyltransferase/precorrin-2 dehydrogenase/sirohydrochlorin ferrochelatase
MRPFPLFATLQGQPCLLVGGGLVAARKARQLLAADAVVTVVAPELCTELSAAVADGRLQHDRQRFIPESIANHLLVIAATSDRAVNREVASAAAEARRLCNVVDDPELSSFIMPAVIDRAPLMIAISTGGASPVLARLLRERIEDWLPTRIGELVRWSGQWRAAVKNRIHDQVSRLRFWERLLDGPVADAVLNGRIEYADREFERELNHPDTIPGTDTEIGEAWLVGAGPGNPDLLTRRGTELLRRADAVLYDRLVSPDILALVRRDARLIPVGKSPHGPSTNQQDINELLVQLVSQGLRVCRLKGGDPLIFGRGGEEIEALTRAGLPVEVVPGITAAAGCAAAAKIPLTHRDASSAVTFVTGHDAGDGGTDWPALAASRQTLAIYMSVARLKTICDRLTENGRSPNTPAAIVENGTTKAQRIVAGTLETIADQAAECHIAAPAILMVGDVVALAGTLQNHQEIAAQTKPPIAA